MLMFQVVQAVLDIWVKWLNAWCVHLCSDEVPLVTTIYSTVARLYRK